MSTTKSNSHMCSVNFVWLYLLYLLQLLNGQIQFGNIFAQGTSMKLTNRHRKLPMCVLFPFFFIYFLRIKECEINIKAFAVVFEIYRWRIEKSKIKKKKKKKQILDLTLIDDDVFVSIENVSYVFCYFFFFYSFLLICLYNLFHFFDTMNHNHFVGSSGINVCYQFVIYTFNLKQIFNAQ